MRRIAWPAELAYVATIPTRALLGQYERAVQRLKPLPAPWAGRWEVAVAERWAVLEAPRRRLAGSDTDATA